MKRQKKHATSMGYDSLIHPIMEQLRQTGFLPGPSKPEVVAILSEPIKYKRRRDGAAIILKPGTYLTLFFDRPGEVLAHYGEDYFPILKEQYLVSN